MMKELYMKLKGKSRAWIYIDRSSRKYCLETINAFNICSIRKQHRCDGIVTVETSELEGIESINILQVDAYAFYQLAAMPQPRRQPQVTGS
jgi:hypothetical protein